MSVFFSLLLVLCLAYPSPPTTSGDLVYQGFDAKPGGHVGIDYLVPVWSPVYATLNGVVIMTVEDSGVYGRFITIADCKGNLLLYAHLAKIEVSTGDIVSRGQLIGFSGGDPYDQIDGDGQSTGWHLHFEVRPSGYWDTNQFNINPLAYLEPISRRWYRPE